MDADLSTGVTQLTYSATVVWLMQQAKNARWLPWVSQNSGTINRAVAIVSSGLVAMGVHWTMGGTGYSIHEGGVLTVRLPGLMVAAAGLLHWFQSFVTQETLFQIISNKVPSTEWRAESVRVVEEPVRDASGKPSIKKTTITENTAEKIEVEAKSDK